MKIEELETYTKLSVFALAEIDKDAMLGLAANKDLVLELDATIAFSDALAELLELLTEAITEKGKALVVVSPDVAMMDLLDECCICVPTLSEANDYIYMEQLERNF
jgi:predicted nicotinamide N-methyase